MSRAITEETLTELLLQSEEYEDALDLLHPEDEKEPEFSGLKSENFFVSRLAIVVGHTKRSPGAVGVSPIDDYEYFWNTQLARKIQQVAVQERVDCGIFFRDGIGIEGAYKAVAEWGARSCVELHFNSFNGSVIGTETLYGELPASRHWASVVQAQMVEIYDRQERADRGIKERAIGERGGRNVNQLNSSQIPSCLIEPYFGDVTGEAVLANERIDALAKSIVAAHESTYG